MHTRSRSAFSLVELLVVVAIIGIIATFAVPAVQGMLKSSALTNASQALVDQMSLARQHAISKNRIVEVRFYRFADPEIPGEIVTDTATGQFRGFQYFEVSDANVVFPVGKFQRLPDGVIMNQGEKLSTLIGEEQSTRIVLASKLDRTRDPELPRNIKHNYDYIAFRFMPDGSTSLPPQGTVGKDSAGGRWYITLHGIQDINRTNNNQSPPPNFFTWMIDPIGGTSKTFRPGV